MASKDPQHKFCYIYGSFVRTMPVLRTPQSDIDMKCKGVSQTEAEKMFFHKYPHLKEQNPPINISPISYVGNNIKMHISYFQPCNFIELYNNGPKSNFICIEMHKFSDYYRNPDKSALIKYLQQDTMKWVKINGNYKYFNSKIDSHYGAAEFDSVINNLPKPEKDIFQTLQKHNFQTNSYCNDTFGNFIDILTQSQQIKSSNSNTKYKYDFFLSNCFD